MQMRVFALVSIAVLLVGEARAQDRPPPKPTDPCTYTIDAKVYEVPIGVKICFRSPPPYGDVYSLQQCFPPLTELDQVRRGDQRCERYEDRQ